MRAASFRRSGCLTLLALLAWGMAVVPSALAAPTPNEGRLDAFDAAGKPLGSCPLKHTEVRADIAGFTARVTVRQQFHSPFADKIEAVYTFPLSQDAAVDRMTMTVGDRVIEGEIKERGEARAIYEAARAAGHVASLLDQERPNIFTQSAANIEPGEKVDITISYCETLDWKDGLYQFDFPMVVGPRYVPGQPAGAPGTGFSPPTDQVPDADRVTPPVTPEGTRAGHDIAITVNLDAGVPLRHLESQQHEVTAEYPSADKSRAVVKLKDLATIPNKDFVLVYQTASEQIEDTLLTHTDERGKFFTLVLQPPKRVRQESIVPKELVFVVDSSGSMRGFPIDTAKQAMRLCIEGASENDTFNLLTFSGHTSFCFEKPAPNTPENRKKALAFLETLQGSGGTEMMTAINSCLAGQDDPERVRIVCFMTDGFVGNDMAIIDAVKRNAGTARVFSFGIGSSVNRFLLDGMAHAGRGEVHYILNPQQATGAAERFYERVRSPVLTDVELDFDSLAVEEVYPTRVPDLFSSTPVVVKGRYKAAGKGTITLRGKTGEGPFERRIEVDLPAERPQSDSLASLWARAKVEHLMNTDLAGVQSGNPNPAMKEEVLGLGLRYRLLTQFTSFVAVEKVRITEGGQSRLVPVPGEMPEGVSYEGVFGESRKLSRLAASAQYRAFGAMAPSGAAPAPGLAPPVPALPPGSAPIPFSGKPMDRRQQNAAGRAEEAEPLAEPAAKLSPKLAGLAEKLAKEGRDGNLRTDGIEVKAGRVEVRVMLASLTDETLAKLKALGFAELGRAKSVKMLIGTIEVAKLEELSKLAEVLRIDPAI